MTIWTSHGLRATGTAAILAAGALSLAADHPRPGPGCPDTGIRTEASEFKFGPMTVCGSGVSLTDGRLNIQDPVNRCPGFVIYEPKRDVPTPKAGFRAVPDGMVPVVEYRFRCASVWLLGWIPIPVGSACRVSTSKNLYSLRTYREQLCDAVATEAR